MRKLRMELDALAVQSFVTGHAGVRSGTVRGAVDDGGSLAVIYCTGPYCPQNNQSLDPAAPCGGAGYTGSTCNTNCGQQTCHYTDMTNCNDSCYCAGASVPDYLSCSPADTVCFIKH